MNYKEVLLRFWNNTKALDNIITKSYFEVFFIAAILVCWRAILCSLNLQIAKRKPQIAASFCHTDIAIAVLSLPE